MMKFALSIALVLLSLSSPAYQIVDANTIRLRVLTYNIKGLPELINPGWDEDRFHDIGAILSARKLAGTAPDIVLLQEAFGPRTPELIQAAGYRFSAEGPSNLKFVSSGLYILTDFPIAYSQTTLYGDFDCGTWDCFASKGAVAARLQIPGLPFLLTIANTHAQSGGNWNEPRSIQLDQFADFVTSLINPDVGVLAAGDFNTRPSRPSYGRFVSRTHFSNVGETCLVASTGCTLIGNTNRQNLLEKSEDQFFYASGRRVTIRPISVERNFSQPINGRMLSDHLGYETVLEIQSH